MQQSIGLLFHVGKSSNFAGYRTTGVQITKKVHPVWGSRKVEDEYIPLDSEHCKVVNHLANTEDFSITSTTHALLNCLFCGGLGHACYKAVRGPHCIFALPLNSFACCTSDCCTYPQCCVAALCSKSEIDFYAMCTKTYALGILWLKVAKPSHRTFLHSMNP